jgi:hypothetical protein
MKLKQWKSPRKLEKDDLCFEGCASSELNACMRYEYYREYLLSCGAEGQWDLRQPLGRIAAIEWFCEMETLPDTPWLKIPEDLRSQYIKEQTPLDPESVLNVRILKICEKKDIEPWLSDAMRSYAGELFCLLAVRKGKCQKKDLVISFEKFVDAFDQKNTGFFLRKKGGRGGPMDKLHHLAAYRIRCGRNGEDALQYYTQITKTRPAPWVNKFKLNESRDKAKKWLEKTRNYILKLQDEAADHPPDIRLG